MSRAAAGRKPARTGGKSGLINRLREYFKQSEMPLTSLMFLLPLICIYELGTVLLASRQIVAFNLMQEFFGLFGATGRFLPPLAVIGILLAWHMARNDSWKVQTAAIAGMYAECLILALPVLAMCVLINRYPSQSFLQAGGGGSGAARLILPLGAGIYEELVFRLIAFTALYALLVDLLKMPKLRAYLIIVLVCSLLFSVYHYLGQEGREPFRWQAFVFRTLAGGYFGAIFLTRGFGVTAGCHAAYDLMLLLF